MSDSGQRTTQGCPGEATADPSTIADDIRSAYQQLAAERLAPTVTVHHPRCPRVQGGSCTCGGDALPFPAR